MVRTADVMCSPEFWSGCSGRCSWSCKRRKPAKGRPTGRAFAFVTQPAKPLGRVVHLELDRVRGVLEADHLLHLQVDVAVDEVVVEYPTGLEEGAILVQLLERLTQA